METPDEQRSSPLPHRYLLSSKLQVEDKIVLLGPLSLTLRQAVILSIGGSLSLHLWHVLSTLVIVTVLRFGLSTLPALLAAIIALVPLQGRSIESWVLIVFRYLLLPKRYCWQQVPSEKPQALRDQDLRKTRKERIQRQKIVRAQRNGEGQ